MKRLTTADTYTIEGEQGGGGERGKWRDLCGNWERERERGKRERAGKEERDGRSICTKKTQD